MIASVTMTPKLEAQASRLDYFQPRTNTRLTALAGVNLQVMDGEFVSIVGPSGCGKSTLLNAMAGLERPFEGQVLVAGEAMLAPRPEIGMVFQQPHLFPWKSVRRNIAHGPRALGKPKAEALRIADDLIEMIGLT